MKGSWLRGLIGLVNVAIVTTIVLGGLLCLWLAVHCPEATVPIWPSPEEEHLLALAKLFGGLH